MPAEVYPNTDVFVTSSTQNNPTFSTEQPLLQLSNQDRLTITQQFMRQLSLSCLTPRAYRLTLAIFRQTIGFNKLEDDMNGTRLQQVANMYPHHANKMVRTLETNHILITRQGCYGKFLSINFNFAQWLQDDCEQAGNNNPTTLLTETDDDIDEPIIEPIIKPRATTKNNVNKQVINKNTNQHLTQKNDPEVFSPTALASINSIVDEAIKNSPLLEPIQQQQARQSNDIANIIQAIGQLETQVKSLLDDKKASTETENKPEPTTEQPQNQSDPHHPVENPADTDALIATTEADLSEKPDLPTTMMANHLIDHTIDHLPENTAETVAEPTLIAETSATPSLHFPSQLNQQQCDSIEKLLEKANDKAQLLLDMLNKRLLNTDNPVKNPVGYLHNLVTRLLKNQLDIPTDITSIDPDNPRPDSELTLRHLAHHEAAADCMYMERNLKLLAEKAGMSFQEYLKDFNLREMWQPIVDRFKETKVALEAVQLVGA